MKDLISGDNISYIFVLAALGLVPLVFMACTSYLKISIVLSVLRNALGGGQIPSQAMSGVITLVLTVYTMAPVFNLCIEAISGLEPNKSNLSPGTIVPKIKLIGEPFLKFMRLNTPIKERAYFLNLHNKRNISSIESEGLDCKQTNTDEYNICIESKEGLPSLLLSFLASELRSGCAIGVNIFLPFLAVDLIISTILTAIGMMMVSPVTISLPVKLILFVLSDGWRLIMENLILSYNMP